MKKYLHTVLTTLLLLFATDALAQQATVTIPSKDALALSEETPVALGKLPDGSTFTYLVSQEGTKTVTFEIVDVTDGKTLKSVTSQQNSAGFAVAEAVNFSLAIDYNLAKGHSYEARFKEYASMSTLGKTPTAAHNFLMDGTANVAVYSNIKVVSISPSSNVDVELDTPIIITFSAPVASLKVVAVIGQMMALNVSSDHISTSDNTTWQVTLEESYFSEGAISLNFIAADSNGNRVTDDNNGVGLPESCYIQYGWASTIGLPTPKLVQDGKSYTEALSVFNFMYDGIGLNQDNLTATWKNIAIARNGQDLGIEMTEDMFKVLGDESVGGTQLNLTLKEALKYNGEYTLTLPARAFVLGHDNANSFNGPMTYSFTLTGLEDKPEPAITINLTKTSWGQVGSDNGETLGTATLVNSEKFDHFEFEIRCEEDPDQYITIASSMSNPGDIVCYDPRKLYSGYHYTLVVKAFDVPYYGVAPIAVEEYAFVGQGPAAPVYADITIESTTLKLDEFGAYICDAPTFDVTFSAPVARARAWNAAGFDGSTPLDIVQKDAEGLVWTVTLPDVALGDASDARSCNVNITAWDADDHQIKGTNGDHSIAYSIVIVEPTAIAAVQTDAHNAPAFTTTGQRAGRHTKGIVIRNGKKYIQK